MHDHNVNWRKPMRAQYFDYSRDGSYFISTVIFRRMHLLGRVVNGAVIHNEAGLMADHYWRELENKYPHIRLDDIIIQPNHVHGIITVQSKSAQEIFPVTLGDIMRWFKTQSTNAYTRGVREYEWPRLDGHLWQPQFWDHIVRDDNDLMRIREYIAGNPWEWEQGPDNIESDGAWI